MKLNRCFILALIAIGMSAGGSAKAVGSDRVVRAAYEGFRGVASGTSIIYPSLPGSPGMTFDGKPSERFVEVEVVDGFAEDVRAVVWLDRDYDWTPERTIDICGTSGRIRIPRGARVGVDLFAGTCNASPSLPTAGEVVVTFSDQR